MRTREEWGWDKPRPCPPWCVVTDHLGTRLEEKIDDYRHEGEGALFLHENIYGERSDVEITLSQYVKVDERGENTLRAEVTIDSQGHFSPAEARRVAETILDWANRAEADTEWRKSQGYAVGPDLDALEVESGLGDE
jgi:hypothetical protein